MNSNISKVIEDIESTGILRDGYNEVFEKTMKLWCDTITAETAVEMMQVLATTCSRLRKNGEGRFKNTATYLIAAAKRRESTMSVQNVAQVLEVVGIMFKYGGLVMDRIHENFADPALSRMTSKIKQAEVKLYVVREACGKASEVELRAVEQLFNV